MSEEQSWPSFPEHEDLFDWSLSNKQIEQKYSPTPLLKKLSKEKKVQSKKPQEVLIIDDVHMDRPSEGTLLDKITKKYPYAGEQLSMRSGVSRGVWAWFFDNFLNK